MNRAGQLVQADLRHHREGDAVDHFTGVPGYDGGAQNRICPVANMDFHEALFFPIGDGAVDIVHRKREGLDRYVALARLFDIEAHVSD